MVFFYSCVEYSPPDRYGCCGMSSALSFSSFFFVFWRDTGLDNNKTSQAQNIACVWIYGEFFFRKYIF